MLKPPSNQPETVPAKREGLWGVYKNLKRWRVKQIVHYRHRNQFAFLLLWGWPHFVGFLFYISLWKLVEGRMALILPIVLLFGILVGLALYDKSQAKRQRIRFLWIPWLLAFMTMCLSLVMALIWSHRFAVQSHALSDAKTNYAVAISSVSETNLYWSNRLFSASKSIADMRNPVFRFNLLANWAWFDFTNANYSQSAELYKESFEAQATVRQTNFNWTLSPIYQACSLIPDPTPDNCQRFTNFVNELTRENLTRGYDICKGEEGALRSIRPMIPTNLRPCLDRNADQLFDRAKTFAH